MANIKLGKLTVAAHVPDKPVGIRNDGTLIFPKELLTKAAPPSFGLSLVSPENKTKLAVTRLKAEPDFTIGIINKVGSYTKAEIIQHIEHQTSLGKEFTDIEVKYAEFFANQILGKPEQLIMSGAITAVKDPIISRDWNAIAKVKLPTFKSRVLFCENTTDSVTNQCAMYRIANVHPVFAAKGYEVISLEGVNDIRSNFVTKAKDKRVVYISGLGHGSYTAFTGHNFNHILDAGAYDSLEVSNKVIHLLSCETARDLGPNTVSKGAKAFVGYTENFVFDWTNSNMYWKCDSQFDLSMAAGKTVEQAIADTVAQFNTAINSVPGTQTAAYLLNDRNLLRSPVSGAAWGVKTSKIYASLPYIMSFAEFAAM